MSHGPIHHPEEPELTTVVPTDVAEWFSRRTFVAGAVPTEELAAAKAASGTSVSVVLPAKDEADTIVGVVEAVSELAGTLVDELVVLDGGSGDGTAELAADAGARVHTDASVLADLGPPRGKGDAMWRSLAITSGDIVAFVDTDIRNPHPRFVSGLLEPLLTDPDVQFVKAFYDRPIEVDGVIRSGGGGRVTELLARPLLNLFWPELAGLVQPLAGEYAGRRSLLTKLPFFTGYGVELGLCVDVLRHAGIDALAQVDLSERIHRNQDITDLSRMAFGILAVAMRRLDDEGAISLAEALPQTYVQFARDAAGRVTPEASTLGDMERPPMVEVSPEAG